MIRITHVFDNQVGPPKAVESNVSITRSLDQILASDGTLAGIDEQQLVDAYERLSLDLRQARDDQTIEHMVAIEEVLRVRDIDPDGIITEIWDE